MSIWAAIWSLVAAGHMAPEAVLMMNALMAMKLAQGAAEVYGQVRGGADAGRSAGGGEDEVVDLPGGGRRVRIRSMDGLRAFMKSQQ